MFPWVTLFESEMETSKTTLYGPPVHKGREGPKAADLSLKEEEEEGKGVWWVGGVDLNLRAACL